MIKTKHLVILGIALAVLLAVNLMQKRGHKKATSQASHEELVASDIVPADLGRITIGHGDDAETVVLSNTPVGWTVDTAWHAIADQSRIETLVRNVSGLDGEFRSDNADVLDDYGLIGEQVVTIRGYDPAGDEVMAIDLGRKTGQGQGNFVRQPANDKAYLTQTNVMAQLGIYSDDSAPTSRYFLKLQAVKEDRLDVDQMTITGDEGALNFVKVFAIEEPDSLGTNPVLDRNTWEWQLAGPDQTALMKTKVDAVLNSMVAVRATDLVDPKADLATYGLFEPRRSASFTLQDGRIINLIFGDKREAVDGAPAGTFMRMSGEATIWVVTDYAVNNIFKSLADLKQESDS